ncbi:putative Ribosomal protein L1p L10e family [Trypanosoma vivax]|nr:hypothetical protein TRVL_03630 [Trypanosoma vivax]KAH8620500.1 putative Ribosomal protein L1p L10e family [Trypanosoma vivax]
MLETPRLREALEKLSRFISSGKEPSKKHSTLDSLFTGTPQKAFQNVEVDVAYLVAPSVHRVPLYFDLPHEVLQGTMCIVTPPPQRKYKDVVLRLSEGGEDLFQRVKKVIDTKKLDMKFSDPVAVRALAKSFDHFVVVDAKTYPKQLTGEFIGHQRVPIWVSQRGGFAQSVRKAARTVVVPRRGHNCVSCLVGHTGLSLDELQENVEQFLNKLTSHPQGATPDSILHVRVAGKDCSGRRATLTIFCHQFEIPQGISEERDGEDGPKRKKAKKG